LGKKCIGNVKLQLAVAKEVLWLFDQAQERRNLNQTETTFKAKLKATYLGMLVLDRMKAKQRSRLTNIKCADVNSKLFYLRANGRKRKKYIPIMHTPHGLAISHEDKEVEIVRHFSGLLGMKPHGSLSLNWSKLDYPWFDLVDLESDIIIEEIKWAISKMPKENTPGQMASLELSTLPVGM
jgi:hypothetical protein